jgi:hypothetical protein
MRHPFLTSLASQRRTAFRENRAPQNFTLICAFRHGRLSVYDSSARGGGVCSYVVREWRGEGWRGRRAARTSFTRASREPSAPPPPLSARADVHQKVGRSDFRVVRVIGKVRGAAVRDKCGALGSPSPALIRSPTPHAATCPPRSKSGARRGGSGGAGCGHLTSMTGGGCRSAFTHRLPIAWPPPGVQGGFGKVYEVVRRSKDGAEERYAMKEISKRTVLDRNQVAMILNERFVLGACVLAWRGGVGAGRGARRSVFPA